MTPSARRFSLEKAILLSMACRGLRNRRFFVPDLELAAVGGVGTEQQARELRAPGARAGRRHR